MSKELAIIEPASYAVMTPLSEMAQEALDTNMEGITLNLNLFDKITIPTGGSQAWSYTLNGETMVVKSLEMILVGKKCYRAYWSKAIGASTDKTPDCTSDDGDMGTAFGLCDRCSYNQYGSKIRGDGTQGAGKACSEKIVAMGYLPESPLPVLLSLPATSLKPFSAYMLQLTGLGRPVGSVVTQIELDVEKNSGGIEYSVARFTNQKLLSEDDYTAFKAKIGPFVAMIRTLSATRTEEAFKEATVVNAEYSTAGDSRGEPGAQVEESGDFENPFAEPSA